MQKSNVHSMNQFRFTSKIKRILLSSMTSLTLLPNPTTRFCQSFSYTTTGFNHPFHSSKTFARTKIKHSHFLNDRYHQTYSWEKNPRLPLPIGATIDEGALGPLDSEGQDKQEDNRQGGNYTLADPPEPNLDSNIVPDQEIKESDDILSIPPSEIDFVQIKSGYESESSSSEPGVDRFVKMFRGSAAYIANHRNSVVVYHIPGEFLEYSGFADLIDDIALTWLLGTKIILVIGCRHQIDSRLTATIPSTPNQNSAALNNRVTNLSTLRVAKEEAGYARFEVERQLARALRLHHVPHKSGGNVISGNFFAAQPFGVVNGVDYQYTGVLRRVEVEKIKHVHEANDIVLLTTLGFSPSGEIFNVNSEALASGVAGAVKANKIIFFAYHQIQMRKRNEENRPLQNLRLRDAKLLLNHYRIKVNRRGYATFIPNEDGSNPIYPPPVVETLLKLGWSIDALEKGVKRAHIITPTNGALLQELYTRDGSGTLISRDLYEGIRRADVNDVAMIYDLIDPLVCNGALIPRPKSVLEKDIKSYFVYTRDEMVVATGQLKRYEGAFAEIGCLVVHKDYRRGGRGDAMLGFLERLCLKSGATKVFVLSTQTMEWFVERGFREAEVSSLPPSKQNAYNHERKSRVYVKTIHDRTLDEDELMWDRN